MLKTVVYGRGGIGKFTISSSLSMALSERGYKAIQIGCDPKADSTIQLHQGHTVASILDITRARGDKAGLGELMTEGSGGVLYAEVGGSAPGMGYASRGTITAFEVLEEGNAFEIYKSDVVIYDVLGDVAYGDFAMPTREGYADKVFAVMSGKNMATYMAASMTVAVKSFEVRGYANLEGTLLSRHDVKREQERVKELAEDMETEIIDSPDYSPLVGEAEELGKTVMEAHPDSDMAEQHRRIADTVLAACGEEEVKKAYA